jgi:hypothetical protein
MERAAVLQLCRRDIQDTLAGAFGDHVNEAEQILGRITEAHAAPDAAFEVGCRAAHVERHHALVGIPDVDHAIGVLVGRGHLDLAQ